MQQPAATVRFVTDACDISVTVRYKADGTHVGTPPAILLAGTAGAVAEPSFGKLGGLTIPRLRHTR